MPTLSANKPLQDFAKPVPHAVSRHVVLAKYFRTLQPVVLPIDARTHSTNGLHSLARGRITVAATHDLFGEVSPSCGLGYMGAPLNSPDLQNPEEAIRWIISLASPFRLFCREDSFAGKTLLPGQASDSFAGTGIRLFCRDSFAGTGTTPCGDRH